MAFRSKSKPVENSSTAIALSTLARTSITDDHNSEIERLQHEIEYKEKVLNICTRHTLLTLNANIDDMKLLIDQKRREQKLYKLSVCDLWLRLKTIEQMESFSLVKYLRINQLHRSEINLSEINRNDSTETDQHFLTKRRRSRLIHFHICAGSDVFHSNIDSYVGLLIFSYENQPKFILNRHHCQRGDIIIKQTKFFNQVQISHRGLYDALFKWYFNRVIDEKFFGVGFLYLNGKWRFDLITYDNREFLLYEYRLFDMFMLTHWLTQFIGAHNAQEMEIHAKDILLGQYDIVKRKLLEHENTELFNRWDESIGSDITDLHAAIERFMQTTEKEIDIIFKEADMRTTLSS